MMTGLVLLADAIDREKRDVIGSRIQKRTRGGDYRQEDLQASEIESLLFRDQQEERERGMTALTLAAGDVLEEAMRGGKRQRKMGDEKELKADPAEEAEGVAEGAGQSLITWSMLEATFHLPIEDAAAAHDMSQAWVF